MVTPVIRRLPALGLMLGLLAVCAAVPTFAQPAAGNGENDAKKTLRRPNGAEFQKLWRLVADLRRNDANAVRQAEDALVEMGREMDIEEVLQSAVAERNLEAAWRARRILNKLDREILGYEFFERRWREQEQMWAEGNPAMPGETPEEREARLEAERQAQDAAAQLTLQGVLVAPMRIELHPNPQPGQYVTYFVGDPEPGMTILETWAVVDVDETSVWVETHTSLLESVVMLMQVDRESGHVIRAFGGREGQAVLAPIAATGPALLRVANLPELKDVPAKAVEVPAGEFGDAKELRHSIEIPDIDGTLQIEVADTISGHVYFQGVLQRRDVEAEANLLQLKEWGGDFVRTAFPAQLVTVTFNGQRYEIAEVEYLAHQEGYDAGTQQPPAIYQPLGPAFDDNRSREDNGDGSRTDDGNGPGDGPGN